MFSPVSNQPDFPAMEEDILAAWAAEDTFGASLAQRAGGPEFVFYDGPPFATGLPHYGHLLAGTIKDVIPRYQTMRGKHVGRVFGWDCHGLPIEALAQEALGVNGAHEIRAYGVDKFNEQCRSMVLRYVAEWRRTVTRMGRWVDFDHDYKTMDPTFMETIWWIFRQLWDQGRIYKSYRIMPYSWKLNTPLSNFEAGSNYQEVQDPAITCRLRVVEGAPAAWGETHLLIWTTTPWTLPGNLAVCAGPEIDYVAVRDAREGVCYVLAEARLAACYPQAQDCTVVARLKGTGLAGWRYAPLFPYYAGQPGAFRVLNDGFVTTEDGTGLVHLAPAFGEDDFRVCRAAGIAPADPLDENCCFTGVTPEYAGRFCKDCDKDLIRRLKQEGSLVHQTTITHSYPFCDRTDTPLIYRAIEAWYVRVEDVRDDLVAANQAIHWVPAQVGEKRFGNWLREAKDWNISRNRFWGSCIPVWVNEQDPQDMICVGSVAELEALSGQRVADLHKHFVDQIVIVRDGKTYRRTPEVLDCWFESGAMPYAQHHYPFADQARFEANFPADFIAEGLDQTRGWFYTLVVLGTALFGQAPFRNVIVNGLVLAEDGQKMSKRKKNYPDPGKVIDAYGADALRLFLLGSQVVHAEDLRFSEHGVREVLRQVLIPLWNAYSFFVTYARLDGWTPAAEPAPPATPAHALDRWILSSLAEMVDEIRGHMDAYRLQKAANRFAKFVEDLTNWYIRRSRRRFWKSQDDGDKDDAYRTLHFVLLTFCRTAAPFIPFVTDAIYRNLRTAAMPSSVHLCDYPGEATGRRDPELERQMDLAMTVVQLGRHLRTEHSLRVRQPLRQVVIVAPDPEAHALLLGATDLIADELNVKAVTFLDHERDLVTRRAKANFKTLGKRLGKEMKEAAAVIAELGDGDLDRWQADGILPLRLPSGTLVELGPEDILVERQERPGLCAATGAGITVGLDTTLDQALAAEGFAREFISRIQNYRKECGLDVADRIEVVYSVPPAWAAAIATHHDHICTETLATALDSGDPGPDALGAEVAGEPCRIAIRRNVEPVKHA